MAAERVTVQVESNIGEDGPLTVNDVLRQFLDAFDLISAAIAEEHGGDTVRWRLVTMTKNSPASATAEAYSIDLSIEVGPIAYRGKRRFATSMERLSGGVVDSWLVERASLARGLFKRNLNGVGRTVIDTYSDLPQSVVVERTARAGIQALDRAELERQAQARDLSRTEWGSIEANVAEAKTYHSQPALYVEERLSQTLIPCALSDEAAKDAGPTHSWSEIWTGKRVRIRGQIFCGKAGEISRVRATKIVDVQTVPVVLAELRQDDILRDRSPVDYLTGYWEGDLG